MSSKAFIDSLESPLVREFEWNGSTFFVMNTPCSSEDSIKLLTAIIHQAVKDFERLAHPSSRTDKVTRESWSTASQFLFDNNYLIDFGDLQLNLSDMLLHISPKGSFNVPSLRRSLIQKTNEYWEDKGETVPEGFWTSKENNE